MSGAGDLGRSSHVLRPWKTMSSSCPYTSDHDDEEEEEEFRFRDKKRRRKYTDSIVDFHFLQTDLNLHMVFNGNLARISVCNTSKTCVFVPMAIGGGLDSGESDD